MPIERINGREEVRESEASLAAWVDCEIPLERSYLLRYWKFLLQGRGTRLTLEDLQEASRLCEGIAIHRMACLKGVEIDTLDLSSLSYTGTVKTGSGCYISACCRKDNVKSFVILSSGNKANSLRAYALRLGVSVISVVPEESVAKLCEIAPSAPDSRDLVIVMEAGTDEMMKAYGRRLAHALGVPCQPIFEDYQQVDRLRALAYAEHLVRHGIAGFTHFFQPVSSNYGLYGTFRGLTELAERGLIRASHPIPVGVQQGGICPLVDIFENGVSAAAAFEKAAAAYLHPTVFERTLFTTHPATVEENGWLKKRFGGRFMTVSWEDLLRYYATARNMLEGIGILLPGELHSLQERTGIMGLVAILMSIDSGYLCHGDRVLLHFTGGVDKLPPFSGKFSTVLHASTDMPVPRLVEKIRTVWNHQIETGETEPVT